ncbi:hypothetical protein IKQ26_02845 [bacterium]|nr:hypothetical protein [bacterium]
MDTLELFYSRIPQEVRETSNIILYFVYYCQEKNYKVTPILIKHCYETLSIKPYSNISAYLNSKAKRKNPILLKNKNCFRMSRKLKEEIAIKLNEIVKLPVTNNLIPINIFDNTRQYIISTAEQMCKCYDYGLYDAALVMMRKLLETLIIECYERYGVENEIKKDGHYLFLSELIPAFLTSTHWTAGRNIANNIPKIKKWGDTSAHTRRFIAKKTDFNDFKSELRIVLEDIVLLIDYPNWNIESKGKK